MLHTFDLFLSLPLLVVLFLFHYYEQPYSAVGSWRPSSAGPATVERAETSPGYKINMLFFWKRTCHDCHPNDIICITNNNVYTILICSYKFKIIDHVTMYKLYTSAYLNLHY